MTVSTAHPVRPAEAAGLLRGHEPALDGLRAVSIGFVLAYHGDVGWARGGFLGISVFFALSGFLVATVLLRSDRDGGIRATAFWARRIRRLFPAAMAGLVLVGIYAATAASEEQVDGLPGQAAAAAANVANWKFIADGSSYAARFEAPSPVLHYWSLSVEEQFYLLAPLALGAVLGARRWRRHVPALASAAAVAAVAWGAWLHDRGAGLDRLYYGTDVRSGEILLGVAAAVALDRAGRGWLDGHRRGLGVAGLGALGALTALVVTTRLSDAYLWRGGFALCAGLTALAVAGALGGWGPMRALAWGPVAAVGRISYGVYLFHFPLFLWLTPQRTGLDGPALLAVRVAATLLVATVSYHLLEMPIRQGWTPSLPRRWVPAVVPATALAAVAVVAIGSATSTPEPLGNLGDATAPISEVPDAADGDRPADGVLDVLVIGDDLGSSTLDQLEPALADDGDVAVTRGPAFSCGGSEQTPDGILCRSWVDEWVPAVEDADPDLVLLLVTDWQRDEIRAELGIDSVEDVARTLRAGLDLLTTDGATVLWAPPNRGLRLDDQTFGAAMQVVLSSRPDIRMLASMPGLTTDRVAYTRGAATELAARLGELADGGDGQLRIMLVGDSQIASLASGLERWAAAEGTATVWSAAVHGCPLLAGETRGATDDGAELDEACRTREELWDTALDRFRPDVVVVQAGLDDLLDRRFADGEEFVGPGAPRFDDLAVDVFGALVDRLSSRGARVVWLTSPCVVAVELFPGVPNEFDDDPARAAALNDVVEVVHDARPEVMEVIDLAAILCPGGEFVEAADGIEPIRPDGVHLSPDASVWLGRIIGPELVAVAGG